LEATVGCPELTNFSFVDARTDSVIQNFENPTDGERKEAETDLSIGDSYSYYIQACDQGECHQTPVHKFTIGQAPSSENPSSSVRETVVSGIALSEEVRDEDFNPLGGTTPPGQGEALSKGYINKLEEDSNQLDADMDTDTLQDDRDRKWVNSDGTNDSADQYAITPFPNWSISNRGNAYPPWKSYYRNDADRRISTDDDSSEKTEKVFANSLAVVADQEVEKDVDGDDIDETIARQGQGVWIDPDQIEETQSGGVYEYPGDWTNLLRFNLDITGPDSGLGYDNDGTTEKYQDGRKVVRTDIYWKKD
jgi:hypothetical protein